MSEDFFADNGDYCCHRCHEGVMMRMILCPECGCKRCPKASDHELACTDSNDPGQPGSVYKFGGHSLPAEVPDV